MPYLDGLPVATSVSSTDLIVLGQGGTPGVPGTSTTRVCTVGQIPFFVPIGGANVNSIAALRGATLLTLPASLVYVLGYRTGADGGEGVFWVSTDTTSADNGGTIIVDTAGRRWYRELGGQAVTFKQFGAVGDGTTDDTTACNNALSANFTNVIATPGTYAVKGLAIANPLALTVMAGATIFALFGMNAKLINIASDNVQIIGPGTLDCNSQVGTNGAPEPIFAITHNFITISGLTIQNSANYGIHLVDCSNVSIRNCFVHNIALPSLSLYTVSANIKNVSVVGNVIDRTNTAFDTSGNYEEIQCVCSTGTSWNSVTIANNECIGKFNVGGTENIVLFCQQNVIGVFQAVSITGNTTVGAAFGISVCGATGATITGNAINGALQIGIELVGSQYCTVSGNSISANGLTLWGFSLSPNGTTQTTGHVLSNNSISGTRTSTVLGQTGAGIHAVGGCDFLTMSGNVIAVFNGNGIVSNNALECTIVGNMIDGATAGINGIDLSGSLSHTVVGNVIYRWTGGAIVGSDASNQIAGNKSDGVIAEQFSISGGQSILGFLSGSVAWTPGTIANGASTGTLFTVNGTALGDVAAGSFSLPLAAGVIVSASAISTNGVEITITNNSSVSQTIGAGVAKVNVWKS